MAGTDGNGNSGLPAKYLALLLVLGPGAGGTASWWFNRDAGNTIEKIEEDMSRSFDVQMQWRDERARDHEKRIRDLERLIYRWGQEP